MSCAAERDSTGMRLPFRRSCTGATPEALAGQCELLADDHLQQGQIAAGLTIRASALVRRGYLLDPCVYAAPNLLLIRYEPLERASPANGLCSRDGVLTLHSGGIPPRQAVAQFAMCDQRYSDEPTCACAPDNPCTICPSSP